MLEVGPARLAGGEVRFESGPINRRELVFEIIGDERLGAEARRRRGALSISKYRWLWVRLIAEYALGYAAMMTVTCVIDGA